MISKFTSFSQRFKSKLFFVNIKLMEKDPMLKKIIHPKTGFSIYMKPFKDSPLFQVSTTETFNINGLHSSYNSPVNICSTTPHMEAYKIVWLT